MEAEAADIHLEELPGICEHKIRCANCMNKDGQDDAHMANVRQCPERLLKLGEVQANAQQQKMALDDGWKATKGRRSCKKPAEVQSKHNEPVSPTTPDTNTFQQLASQMYILGITATSMEIMTNDEKQSKNRTRGMQGTNPNKDLKMITKYNSSN